MNIFSYKMVVKNNGVNNIKNNFYGHIPHCTWSIKDKVLIQTIKPMHKEDRIIKEGINRPDIFFLFPFKYNL